MHHNISLRDDKGTLLEKLDMNIPSPVPVEDQEIKIMTHRQSNDKPDLNVREEELISLLEPRKFLLDPQTYGWKLISTSVKLGMEHYEKGPSSSMQYIPAQGSVRIIGKDQQVIQMAHRPTEAQLIKVFVDLLLDENELQDLEPEREQCQKVEHIAKPKRALLIHPRNHQHWNPWDFGWTFFRTDTSLRVEHYRKDPCMKLHYCPVQGTLEFIKDGVYTKSGSTTLEQYLAIVRDLDHPSSGHVEVWQLVEPRMHHDIDPCEYGWTLCTTNAQEKSELYKKEPTFRMMYYPIEGAVEVRWSIQLFTGRKKKKHFAKRHLSAAQFLDVVQNNVATALKAALAITPEEQTEEEKTEDKVLEIPLLLPSRVNELDPRDFGWTLMDINRQSGVEYYEKEPNVKLDFYPTTGMVLFRKDECRKVFRDISLDQFTTLLQLDTDVHIDKKAPVETRQMSDKAADAKPKRSKKNRVKKKAHDQHEELEAFDVAGQTTTPVIVKETETLDKKKEASKLLIQPRKHAVDPRKYGWKLTGMDLRCCVENYVKEPGMKMHVYPKNGTVEFITNKKQEVSRQTTLAEFMVIVQHRPSSGNDVHIDKKAPVETRQMSDKAADAKPKRSKKNRVKKKAHDQHEELEAFDVAGQTTTPVIVKETETLDKKKEASKLLIQPRKHAVDPRKYGWKLTGMDMKCKVEHYVKESGMKMHLYPTKGTVEFIDANKKGTVFRQTNLAEFMALINQSRSTGEEEEKASAVGQGHTSLNRFQPRKNQVDPRMYGWKLTAVDHNTRMEHYVHEESDTKLNYFSAKGTVELFIRKAERQVFHQSTKDQFKAILQQNRLTTESKKPAVNAPKALVPKTPSLNRQKTTKSKKPAVNAPKAQRQTLSLNQQKLIQPRKHNIDLSEYGWKLSNVDWRCKAEHYDKPPHLKLRYYPAISTIELRKNKNDYKAYYRIEQESELIALLLTTSAHGPPKSNPLKRTRHQESKNEKPAKWEDELMLQSIIPSFLEPTVVASIQSKKALVAHCVSQQEQQRSPAYLTPTRKILLLTQYYRVLTVVNKNLIEFHTACIYGVLGKAMPREDLFYCSVCRMGGALTPGEEEVHDRSAHHILNAHVKSMKEDHPSTKGKAPVDISDPCAHGKFITVEKGVSGSIAFEMKNKSQAVVIGPLVILSTASASQHHHHHHVNLELPPETWSISPNTCETFRMGYCMSKIGHAHIVFAIPCDGGHTTIVRELFLQCLDGPGMALLPQIPFQKMNRRKQRRTKHKPRTLMDGIRPPRPTNPQAPKPVNNIGPFPLPSPDENTRPRLEPLCEHNYQHNMHQMLYLEEREEKLNLEMYDMENVVLITKPQQQNQKPSSARHPLWLRVPGLAEKRPSVLMGDAVKITCARDDDRDSNPHEYTGYVHAVHDREINLGFLPAFERQYRPGTLVHVRFGYSRAMIRKCHQALALTEDPSFPMSLLFPKIRTGGGGGGISKSPDSKSPDSDKRTRQNLNERQNEALELILLDPGVTDQGGGPLILFGPPGTGKSSTIVAAVAELLSRSQHQSRILLCAPSNDVADVLVTRLVKQIPNLSPAQLLRLNAVHRHPPSVPKSVLPYCRLYVNQDSSSFYCPSRLELAQMPVIVTTLGSALQLWQHGLRREAFDTIVIDEAGHASEPEVLCALAPFCTENTQVVLVGDPRQLGPIVQSGLSKEHGFGQSLMERLMKQGSNSKILMLTENYRSHGSIIATSSALFYSNALEVSAPASRISRFLGWSELPNPDVPVIFHGLCGHEMREGQSPSWFNPLEACVILEYVNKVLKNADAIDIRPSELGIISPYHRQVQKVRTLLRQHASADREQSIKIGSCEQFQGQERSVILISTVRSQVGSLSEDRKFQLGFVSNPKRMNVSLTRAQALLIVIGNPHVLKQDPHWSAFLKFCHDNHCCVGEPAYPEEEEAGAGYSEEDPEVLKAYPEEEEAGAGAKIAYPEVEEEAGAALLDRTTESMPARANVKNETSTPPDVDEPVLIHEMQELSISTPSLTPRKNPSPRVREIEMLDLD